MQLPLDVHRITLAPASPEAPLNFAPFDEGNDGAGNYFGLYWPLGQEQQEPLVCFYDHEVDSLTAEYRNLTEFLADKKAAPILADESFFVNPFLKAKLLARKGLVDEALAKVRISLALFGEWADSWALLAQLLLRSGQPAEAAAAARQAMLANWIFGLPDFACFQLFREAPTSFATPEDPLFRRRESLFALSSPAASLQVNFPALWQVIQEYKTQPDPLIAIQLLRNYGYLLRRHYPSAHAQEIIRPDWLTELATLRPFLTS